MPPRRRNPPHLYLRGNVWYSKLRINGKVVRQPLDTDMAEASRKVMEMVRHRDARRFGRAAKDASWESFKDRYFAWADVEKADSTVAHERGGVRDLEAEFKPDRLEQVTPAVLDELKVSLRRQGRPVSQVNRRIRALKTMLRKAEDWQLMAEQSWRTVKKVRGEVRGKLLFWSIQELRRILSHTKDHWLTALMLGARAGLRPGESRHLKVEDVDLTPGKARLHVVGKACADCRSCRKRGNRWEPKDYEQRWIPIEEDLARHLRGRRRQVKTWWVEEGSYRPSEAVFYAYCGKVVRRAKLKGTAHTARHTYASHLVQAGAELDRVRDLLGHRSVTQTEIYAHLRPRDHEKAVSRLPAL